MSGEGLPGDQTVEVDDRKERERDVSKTVKQNDHKTTDGRKQSLQQRNGKPVTRREWSFANVMSQGKARKARVLMGD